MTTGNYYELLADPSAVSRWYLKSPLSLDGNEVDARLFTQGVQVSHQPPLTLPVRREGDEVEFNLCDFDMVVTPSSLNVDLESLVGPAIQRIPVVVEGRKDEFEILNVCDLVQCVDESRSLFTKWTEADGRPDKVGGFRMFAKLKIDPIAASGHDIFRIAGWPIALVVSEKVKSFFEMRNVSGVRFEQAD